MNNTAYKTLYKSVGLPEWRLIVAEQRKRFHSRLLMKPIFYPSLSFDYACKLAKEWNAIDHLSEYVGLVVGFKVPPDFLDNYEKMLQGEYVPGDLWVTVAELYRMNQVIDGRISVYEVFYGSEYQGEEYSPQDMNEDSFLI